MRQAQLTGAPRGACRQIYVSIRTWFDDASFMTDDPSEAGCSSDRNRGQPPAWDSFDGTTYARFYYGNSPDPANGECANDMGTGCGAVNIADMGPEPISPARLVWVQAPAGDSYGDNAVCEFYSAAANSGAGGVYSALPAAVVMSDRIGCMVPKPPMDGDYACGDKVYLSLRTWSPSVDNARHFTCSSTGAQGPSSSDPVTGTASWTKANAVRELMYDCSAMVGCVDPPQIDSAAPGVGVVPGDVVTLTSTGLPGSPSFSNDNVRCLWWYNGVAFRLYEPAVSHTEDWIQCEVPSRDITFGPDAGVTIPPCGDVRVTVQAWDHSVTNPQDNQCFSHEGQTEPHWAVTDYADVQYSCESFDDSSESDCLHGPFGMTWYNGDIVVANEGRGGGGVSLSIVDGPSSASAGDVTTPWITGFSGPSGLAWQNGGTDLLITDDTDGGRIWVHDTIASSSINSFGVGAGSPLPGSNPNAIRTNAANEAIVAYAGSGTISKYDSTGAFMCDLAQGVGTPQAVEIHDAEGKVWFTDSSINLFEVDMACPGGAAPDCSAGACNAVDVGNQVHGPGAHTEGGLIKTGHVFYMSGYASDDVLVYERPHAGNGNVASYSVCVSGVSQARGLLVDNTHIYITSYDTDTIWRAELDCTNLEQYSFDECEDLPESDSDEGMCLDEALFYYKGLVLSDMCNPSDGCDPSRPALEVNQPDGSVDRYYSLGKASDKMLRRCFPASP